MHDYTVSAWDDRTQSHFPVITVVVAEILFFSTSLSSSDLFRLAVIILRQLNKDEYRPFNISDSKVAYVVKMVFT